MIESVLSKCPLCGGHLNLDTWLTRLAFASPWPAKNLVDCVMHIFLLIKMVLGSEDKYA